MHHHYEIVESDNVYFSEQLAELLEQNEIETYFPNNRWAIIWVDDRFVIAMVGLAPQKRDPSSIFIHNLFVRHRFRRCGLGRQLLLYALGSQSGKTFFWECERKNTVALKLYDSLENVVRVPSSLKFFTYYYYSK